MNSFTELIKSFEDADDWKNIVKQNFERKSGIYSYATISNIEVKYNNQVFIFPTKIVFEYGYVRELKQIIKTEKVNVNKKTIIIIEKKKVIPFGFYERGKKYSGEIFQIINDLAGNKTNSDCKFSTDLLATGDNPLYGIDSNQKWPSYVLVLQRKQHLQIPQEDISLEFLNDLLSEYGIHYGYDELIQNKVIVIFPMPYIKVVENKIQKYESRESIFLVLEYNQLGLFYTSQVKIEIETLIKDIKGEVIHKKTEPVKFGKAKFQVVEINPDKPGEIGFTAFSIKINGTLVNKFSGYYIRNIKLDIKIK